jgi:hypothetical protein
VTWLCGGLGAGKTYLLAQWIYDMATVHCPGIDGLLVQPDYDTFHDVFLKTWQAAIPGEGDVWKYSTTAGTRGSSRQLVIYYRKPDGERGETTVFVRSAMNAQTVKRIDGLTTVGWWALDEPARMLCGKMAFNKCIGRGRVPTPLGRNPGLIVGSPDGFNWLARAFGASQDHPAHGYTHGYEPDPKEHPGYYIRACRTTDNARHLAPGYADNMRIAYGDAFYEQECNAALVRAQGQIFPGWHRAVHVVPHHCLLDLWQRKARRSVAGIDWGWASPSVVLPVGATAGEVVLVPDIHYKPQQQAEELGAAWHHFAGLYGLGAGAVCDPSEPANIEKLRVGFEWGGKRLTVPARAANNAWQHGVDTIRNLLHLRRGVPHPWAKGADGQPVDGCPKLLLSERAEELAVEMDGYRQKRVKEGKPPSEQAEGPDHAIDALRYAAVDLVHVPQLEGVSLTY